jgi:hypothetical protein
MRRDRRESLRDGKRKKDTRLNTGNEKSILREKDKEY